MRDPLKLADFSIAPITTATFEIFVAYLNDHLSDNGKPGFPHFQPLASAESTFSTERAQVFLAALDVPLGTIGWRRLWGAFTPEQRLIGHVDLRAHPEPLAAHRCVLGMGVDRSSRKLGLGTRLIEHAAEWALNTPGMEWIDLQVLSVNQPAIRLYQRSGFAQTGEVPEMFKIDGRTFSFTSMSKRLGAPDEVRRA